MKYFAWTYDVDAENIIARDNAKKQIEAFVPPMHVVFRLGEACFNDSSDRIGYCGKEHAGYTYAQGVLEPGEDDEATLLANVRELFLIKYGREV